MVTVALCAGHFKKCFKHSIRDLTRGWVVSDPVPHLGQDAGCPAPLLPGSGRANRASGSCLRSNFRLNRYDRETRERTLKVFVPPRGLELSLRVALWRPFPREASILFHEIRLPFA